MYNSYTALTVGTEADQIIDKKSGKAPNLR